MGIAAPRNGRNQLTLATCARCNTRAALIRMCVLCITTPVAMETAGIHAAPAAESQVAKTNTSTLLINFQTRSEERKALGGRSTRLKRAASQTEDVGSLALATADGVASSTDPNEKSPGSASGVISRCLSSNSSLNLTVEDEATLSYFRLKYSLNRNDSRDKPLESAAGLCLVLMEAPPGKVISILFLNQTCSRDSDVLVEDEKDGWSATFSGCSPWKSPGYDVTTAGRSAAMTIRAGGLVDEFYGFQIHLVAVATPEKNGPIVRYVSPVLGYIQTPGWNPYTKPFFGRTDGVVSVAVPADRVVLVSVVYTFLTVVIVIPSVQLHQVGRDRKRRQRVWVVDTWSNPTRPEVRLLSDAGEIQLQFTGVPGFVFGGFRLLFSFHQTSRAPQRIPGGLWNCSSSTWPDFRSHLVCNNRTECAGREDEMGCPATSCQPGAIQLDQACYWLVRLPPEARDTWHHASTRCERLGAALASFPTVGSWYHLTLLSQMAPPDADVCLGLQSADVSFPHMYRTVLRWANGAIAHYYYLSMAVPPPSCASIRNNFLELAQCSEAIGGNRYGLCRVTSPRHDELAGNSTFGSGKEEEEEGEVEKLTLTGTPVNSFRRITLNLTSKVWERAGLAPTVRCPVMHRAHRFLACDAFSACWLVGDDVVARSGDAMASPAADATFCTGADEGGASAAGVVASIDAMFACEAGAIRVPYSLVCDHLPDCVDNSDEDFCIFAPCSETLLYSCANGQCVAFRQRCDRVIQCLDESDEDGCGVSYRRAFQPRPPLLADFDGRGKMTYTPLAPGTRGHALCPDTHVLCPGSEVYCLPVYVRCNKVDDCPGREDEVGCDSYTCPGFYRCRGLLGTCLHPDHLCDGWPQCLQHDDERFCNLTCPGRCTCLGHAFTCTGNFHFQAEPYSSLRYLDAAGTGLTADRLRRNLLLVHLSLARCDLAHLGNLSLPNLLSLDVSDNRLNAVTIAELRGLKNLRNLSLARNPISQLFYDGNASLDAYEVNDIILHVDLSGVDLRALDVRNNLPFPRLLSLDLSNAGVTRLRGDGFQSLTSLVTLDLRGCPMSDYPRDALKGLGDLRAVLADNYKLCCPVNLPAGFHAGSCRAPFNEVSSCDALLRSDVYRVCLSVLAVLALSGNLGCFCLRVFAFAGRGKTGFNVFVTHLCVSDFVMGVYLAVIGVADRLYLGKYLWEDRTWRHGPACRVAGVLAFLSSEVSALIICLITLDRFLVIRFPFSRLRFSAGSARVACLVTWAGGVALVVAPLLPLLSHWRFYGQTGICVPLPITKNDFAGHRYAFGVMILFNLVVFLVIATGQISVYLSMTSHAMSSVDSTRKSRDLIVARRLVTVVVSDFLCWFPLGLLGVLAAEGVPIPGEVNVAMAIFVLPLNSALNPFLYTLNVIQEKRRRATEVRLLKIIMDRRLDDGGNVEEE